MKDLSTYIKEQILIEELSKDERGNNVLIDQTKNYNLYCGGHLFKRLNRHYEESGNPQEKNFLKTVKKIVCKGFSNIENKFNNGTITQGDPNSTICLILKRKYDDPINVVVYIEKLEIDGVYDIIIKTVMTNSNFYSSVKSIIKESIVIYDEENI